MYGGTCYEWGHFVALLRATKKAFSPEHEMYPLCFLLWMYPQPGIYFGYNGFANN